MIWLLDNKGVKLKTVNPIEIERIQSTVKFSSVRFKLLEYIDVSQRILLKDYNGIWQEYIVGSVEAYHNEDDSVYYEVFAEDSINELHNFYIDDRRPQNVKADIALNVALENTRWKAFRISDSDVKSTNYYHTTARKALAKICEVWGLEVYPHIKVSETGVTERLVDMKKPFEAFRGKRYVYKSNLKNASRTIDYTELYTALYGYGKGETLYDDEGQETGGYGRKIHFAELNDGKKYVEDLEAMKKYGIDGTTHLIGIADFPDCEDKAELLELTKEALKKHSKPKITYKIDVLEFVTDGLFNPQIGEVVIVQDERLKLEVKSRVIEIKDDPFALNKTMSITLGNYEDNINGEFKAIEDLRLRLDNEKIEILEDIKKNKLQKPDFIDSLIDVLNDKMNATGGYTYLTEGDGIIVYDKPKDKNPTMAIQLKGGMIRIANEKLPNGDFNWRTFGTGDGFTADVITAGILKGGKVRWNLEDGTFLIGDSVSDYKLLWDGRTLKINADIDITSSGEFLALKDEINGKVSRDDILTDPEIQTSLKGVDGKDGANGKDGQTPQIIAGYWFINGKSTGIKAVGRDGLDGKDGKDGVNGNDGINGRDGLNGKDGHTPTIVDGMWWINGRNTNVRAQGRDGLNGRDGANGLNGRNGDTPEIRGGVWYIGGRSTGVRAQGADGADGKDGSAVFAYADEVREDGYVINFSTAKLDSSKWIGLYAPRWGSGSVTDPKNYYWVYLGQTDIFKNVKSIEEINRKLQLTERDMASLSDNVRGQITSINAKVNGLTTSQKDEINKLLDTIELIRYVTDGNNQDLNNLEDYIRERIGALYSDLGSTDEQIARVNNALVQYINNLPDEVKAQINDDEIIKQVKKHFTFNNEGLTIGQAGSRYSVNLDNEQLTFRQDGVDVAYINGHRLHITEEEIMESLKIHNLFFTKYQGQTPTGQRDDYVIVNWIDGV